MVSFLGRGAVFVFLIASMLLGIPSFTSPAHAVPAASITLTPGTTTLIGTVDVGNLQETGQSTTNMNMAPLHSQGLQAYDQGKAQVSQSGYVPTGEATKTVTAGPSASTPQTTTVGLVLEGAPGGSPNLCGCSPPDGAVGVGPSHVFEMVNLAGIIYTKTGAIAKPAFGLDAFFNLPAKSMSDPQVSFDASSGRWFASIINITGARVVFAVSTSNDPTGTFNLYSVSDTGHLPDQPVTGTNNDKYVISVNDFNTAGTAYIGVHFWVLNKSELVTGASTIHFATNTPDPNMFSLHPAQHLSSSTTFYMVTDCTGSCIPDPVSTTTTETVVSITGAPPAAVTVTTTSFSIATSVIGPSAAQPGTSTTLRTNDNRVDSVVWESNSLWASWNDACIPSGDTVTRTCLRLVQATTSGATATKMQDFDFAASGQYYFYPAITSYLGQLAVSFGASSSSVYPSALVTGRASGDPINTLQTPATLRVGSAPDTSTRYGDYFGAATDPTPTAASTFWVEAEYRKDSTFQNWNTVIGQVGSFPSSPITVSFNKINTFQTYQTTTTGNIDVNRTSATYSGTASVTVTNVTTSTVILGKTYAIPSTNARVQGSDLEAMFLLNVPVSPYPLGVNIDIKVSSLSSVTNTGLSRLVDIHGSGRVDIIDASALSLAFDSTPTSSKWNPRADLDASGKVDISDAALLSLLFDSPSFS